MKKTKKKTCFVVSPIGTAGSLVRIRADLVFRKIIKPALQLKGFTVKRADHLAPNGDITAEIIDQLWTADLSIVDLDGLNANVMYELGIRLAWRRPVIIIAPNGTQLPFDVRHYSTVFYGDPVSASQAALACRSVQGQLTTIRRRNHKNPAFDRPVEQQQTSNLHHAVVQEMIRTLGLLADDLEDLKPEFENEIEPSKSDALKALADLLRRAFNTFANRVNLLQKLAFPELGRKKNESLVALFQLVGQLIRDGNKKQKQMGRQKSNSKHIRVAGARLDHYRQMADKIAARCRGWQQQELIQSR